VRKSWLHHCVRPDPGLAFSPYGSIGCENEDYTEALIKKHIYTTNQALIFSTFLLTQISLSHQPAGKKVLLHDRLI
jgi:hypothetical protein